MLYYDDIHGYALHEILTNHVLNPPFIPILCITGPHNNTTLFEVYIFDTVRQSDIDWWYCERWLLWITALAKLRSVYYHTILSTTGNIFVTHVHDVIKWKHFPRYWPFVLGIHLSSVNFPHKGQWRGASKFSFNKRFSKQTLEIWDAIALIMTSL